MNNKLLISLPLTVLLASCAPAKYDASDLIDCPDPHPAPVDCTDPPHVFNRLTINTASEHLIVEPLYLCVHRMEPIEVNILPAMNKVVVMIGPKDDNAAWPHGDNIGHLGSITIPAVPDGVPHETDQSYSVLTSNGKCMDPTFHVD